MPPLNIPQHLQETNSSCLPACARMVLDFLGMACSESELRRLLRTRPYGTSILNIRQLETLNVETAMFTGTLEELRFAIERRQPVIALLWTGVLKHWAPENAIDYLHAVVVVGLEAENLQIHDPAFSTYPITVPHAEFLEAWSYARQTMIVLSQKDNF